MRIQRGWTARCFGYATLLVVTLINLLSDADLWPNAPSTAHDDALRYLAMSQHTFAPVDNPFALRLLSPWLAHLGQQAGLGLNDSWLLLTFVATSATLIVFFTMLYDHFRLGLFVSLLSSIMLACTYYFTLFNFTDPWLVDPVNNLFIVLALYAALTRRLFFFAGVIVIGFVNKETMLLFVPLYPLLAWARREPLRGRQFLGGIAVMLACGIAYFGFRLWVQGQFPVSDQHSYTPLSGAGGQSIVDNVRASLGVLKTTQQYAMFDTFHFVWLVFAYGLYRAYRRSGFRDPIVAIGVFAFVVCLFGRLFGSDVQRVFVMMAPVVFLVAALCFARFGTEHHRWWTVVLGLVYVTINLHWVPAGVAIVLDLLATAIFVVAQTMVTRADPDRRWQRLIPAEAEPAEPGACVTADRL